MTAALSTSATLGASGPQRASSAYERMRSRVPAGGPAPVSARVRTRQVGVRLGGFGFTYTAKDLEMGPDIPDKAATLGSLGLTGTPSSASGTAARRTPRADTSAAARVRGVRAYAAQVRSRLEEAMPSSILLSVV